MGEHIIPQTSSYCYLGFDFTSDSGWDTPVKRVISNGRKKVNQLHSIITPTVVGVYRDWPGHSASTLYIRKFRFSFSLCISFHI